MASDRPHTTTGTTISFDVGPAARIEDLHRETVSLLNGLTDYSCAYSLHVTPAPPVGIIEHDPIWVGRVEALEAPWAP